MVKSKTSFEIISTEGGKFSLKRRGGSAARDMENKEENILDRSVKKEKFQTLIHTFEGGKKNNLNEKTSRNL